MYVTYDKRYGLIKFYYARFGDDYNLATKDKILFTENTSFRDFKLSDIYPAVSKNYTDSTVPPAVVMSTYLAENNLYRISKNGCRDFNGDGKKEIAVVYEGYNEDLLSGLDSALPNAMGPVYVKLYQYSATRNDRLTESKSAGKKNFSGWTYPSVSGLGDLKAVTADVDGDGKSELVMLGITWRSRFHREVLLRNTTTMGEWSSQLHIWRHDAPKSGTETTDTPATLNMKYDKQIADFGTFYKSDEQIKSHT